MRRPHRSTRSARGGGGPSLSEPGCASSHPRARSRIFHVSRTPQRHPYHRPASGGAVSDEMLAKLGKLSTQAIVDGLWVMVRKAGARRRGGRGTDTAFLARGPHLNAL